MSEFPGDQPPLECELCIGGEAQPSYTLTFTEDSLTPSFMGKLDVKSSAGHETWRFPTPVMVNTGDRITINLEAHTVTIGGVVYLSDSATFPPPPV